MIFANLNRRNTEPINRDCGVETGSQWRQIDRAIVNAAAGPDENGMSWLRATITGMIVRTRLLTFRWGMNPSEVDDRLIDMLLANFRDVSLEAVDCANIIVVQISTRARH